MKRLLKSLTEAHGVSGYESEISEIIRNELNGLNLQFRHDRMGNFVVTKPSQNRSSYSMMIATHMDEIGLLVKYIDDDGFLWFNTVGGWFDQTLLNQRVILSLPTSKIYGVIGSKPPHKMDAEERNKPIKKETMFIDIGAKNVDDAIDMGVAVGTPIVLDRDFKSLGNSYVTAKAFDNRVGVALMTEIMRASKELTQHQLYGVGTVQEEVGLRGARTSAFGIDPNFALVIDTDIGGGHPGIDKKDTSIELGSGPVITVMDGGFLGNRNLIERIEAISKKNKIPYQLGVSTGGTTDGAAIQLARDGIPTMVVSVPTRYIHSPVEVLDMNDVEDTKRLCFEIVKDFENMNFLWPYE